MRLNWKKLYQSLDNHRQASGGGSWRALAIRAGVTPSLFTRISQGKPTSVRNLLRILAILPQHGIQDFVTENGKSKARLM